MHLRRHSPSRRRFLQSATGAALGAFGTLSTEAALQVPNALAGRLYKTLKIGMVKEGETLADKFRIAKEAGFMGIELVAPGIDVDEALAASKETGLPIDGSVGANHWKTRHSSPDPDTRAKALQELKQALQETHAAGGHTVLVVVGKGEDGSEQEVWDRSLENISQALPLAAELGVSIAIENVWNQFLYDHEGGSDQTVTRLAEYVDAFQSPFVGLQFDIGNHWKYGNTGDWIRELGSRIIKLDVKGFSRATGKFTAIGEGDIDFADVRRALVQINFHGWCAAEVKGGDLAALRMVSRQMDQAFGL